MSAFDDLKREVGETTTAVAEVAQAVADVATRVGDIVAKLATMPDPAEVANLAAQLDAEQKLLLQAKTSLDGIAPAPPPAPAA